MRTRFCDLKVGTVFLDGVTVEDYRKMSGSEAAHLRGTRMERFGPNRTVHERREYSKAEKARARREFRKGVAQLARMLKGD